MFVYARTAIDYWSGWMTEEQYLKQLGTSGVPGEAPRQAAQYEQFKRKAFALAKKVGWEGDIREGPFIAGLPTDETGDDGKIMIAWKQDNNGDTFVASPLKLEWLETGDDGPWTEG